MKNVINKLKTLSKKQKVLVSLAFILVISTVVAINILNFTSPKQDMVSDTSLSSNKKEKDKDKSVDTEKEDTKEKKDTSNENTDKSQEITNENTNSVVESNTSNNAVSNNTSNNTTNNTTSNNTSNNTNQSTNTTPPAQVCTGINVVQSSLGNSGLVQTQAENDAFWDFWENDPNGFYATYGHNSFQGWTVQTVDSCGNPVSSILWTIQWTD